MKGRKLLKVFRLNKQHLLRTSMGLRGLHSCGTVNAIPLGGEIIVWSCRRDCGVRTNLVTGKGGAVFFNRVYVEIRVWQQKAPRNLRDIANTVTGANCWQKKNELAMAVRQRWVHTVTKCNGSGVLQLQATHQVTWNGLSSFTADNAAHSDCCGANDRRGRGKGGLIPKQHGRRGKNSRFENSVHA